MKPVIVIVLLGILGALGWAGVSMLRRRRADEDPDAPDRRMANALTLRIALSVALFLIIMLAWWMGWIKPHGV